MAGGEVRRLHTPCELSRREPRCDPNYDRVTQLAATIFGLPQAALILSEGGPAEVASSQGFERPPMVREGGGSEVTDDGSEWPAATRSPHVRLSLPDGAAVRFSAAAPLIGSAGGLYGSLIVMGAEPRPAFDATECRILQGLADMAVELVELRRGQAVLLERSREIAHLAHHDPLTELGNRRHLDTAMSQAVKALRPQDQIVLYCIDLDGFKRVNDKLGHGAGDKLLRHVTQRLRGSIRPGDAIARLGGDEFAIVQTGEQTLANAPRFAESVIAAVSKPYGLDGQLVRIGASIGAAVGRFPVPPLEQMLVEADRALYRAKDSGRGRFSLFDGGRPSPMEPRYKLSRLAFSAPAPRRQPIQAHS